MKYSTRIKPISVLKARTADVVRECREKGEPVVITQNGEAKAVIQDVRVYEETQETLALLKILALGQRQVERGKVIALSDAVAHVRKRSRR